MEPAPLKDGLFNRLGSHIISMPWVQWFTKLVAQPALTPSGNNTEFLRGDNTWQTPTGVAPGPHAHTHVANSSDPLSNIAQSQIINLATDLSAKALKTTTINTANGLTGGGNLSADQTLTPVYGSAGSTICQGNDSRLVTNGNSHNHTSGAGGTIDHINLSNIGNNSHSEIDLHLANEPIHIDWTNANQNFKTSRNVQCAQLFCNASSQRLYIHSDSTAFGPSIELWSRNFPWDKGALKLLTCCAGGTTTQGKLLFLTTANGSTYFTTGVITALGLHGIGHGDPDRLLHVKLTDTRNTILANQINYIARLGCFPNAAVDVNFGVGLEYELKNSVGLEPIAGSAEVYWVDPANGSEDSNFRFRLLSNGSIVDRLLIKADGGVDFTGKTNEDLIFNFIGTSNSGELRWMEDEDYFKFADDILLPDSEKIQFGTGVDMDIYYDGIDGYIRTDLVAASDLLIDCGTDKTIELQETVWKDINIGAATLGGPPGLQPGTVQFVDEAGANTGIYTYGVAVGEAISGAFELQHDYKEGTDLKFHVHWQGITAPTGTDNVNLELTYTVAQKDTTLNATTVITIEKTFDTQYESVVSSFADIIGTNFNIENQFIFTLKRIAATTNEYAGEALLYTVGIHYEVDTLGSRQVDTK